MSVKWFIERLFGRKPTRDVVCRVFPEDQRGFALEFYEAWREGEYLSVELGSGFHDLTRSGFYAAASFFFSPRPIDMGAYLILGAHSEDDEGTIVLDKTTGKILYAYGAYDDTATELAGNLREFVIALQEAGWQGPGVPLQEHEHGTKSLSRILRHPG